MRRHWGLAALIVVVLACTGMAQTPSGHALLRVAGLYEEPASYTALSFSSPQTLTNAVFTKKARVSVPFTIRNVSGASRTYDWSIDVVHGRVSQVSSKGSVTVAAQGTANVTRSLSTTCPSGRIQLVVRLASPAESIDFWVACPGANGANSG